MRERLEKLPRVMQRLVWTRLASGAASLFLAGAIGISFGDIYFCLPGLLLSAFLLGSGGRLLYHGAAGDYICVEGVCEDMKKSGITKRLRSISLSLGKDRLELPIRQGMKTLSAGDTVLVYVSDRAPVYERGDGYLLCDYYALEVKKECSQNESR